MEKYCVHSILEKFQTDKEIIETIYDRMLSQREATAVEYIPCTENDYMNMVHNPGVDFAQLYPDFEDGDYAYLSCYMDGAYERELLINVRQCSDVEVFFNGERKPTYPGGKPAGSLDADVTFKKGQNTLLVKVKAKDGQFFAYVVPMLPGLRMYPGSYVYSTRQYIEAEGFEKQTGLMLSRLYKKGEAEPFTADCSDNSASNPAGDSAAGLEVIDWVFPVKPLQSDEKQFDFEKLCGKGYAAYVHTWVQGDLTLHHDSPMKIFTDSRCVVTGDAHGEEITVICRSQNENISKQKGTITLHCEKPTPILLKSCRGIDSWGFTACSKGEHSLPFVTGATCPDLQWLWSGPYGRETDTISNTYAPEKRLQFAEPYATVHGPVYWNFYRERTTLKQQLWSAFFGQWFYAPHVGVYGMKQAAEKLGKAEFEEYFCAWMKMICEHRDYGNFDTKRTGWGSYLALSASLHALDPIGTIGLNLAEYYMMTGDPSAKNVLNIMASAIAHEVPRFEDGTLHRKVTMWTDDMYMALPFLARLAVITGEEKYFADIVTQVKGFFSRMFMEDQGLMGHIFFVKEGVCNRVPWGRGNGWVLLALSEVLLLMPEDYEGRAVVLDAYQKFAAGILKHRDKEKGIWHQVINNPESYIETSGTAMFITALGRGIRGGWIDAAYQDDVLKAWEALLEHCVDTEGNVYGVCMGSGCNMEETYYLDLGTIVNDDHGVGIVLGAGVEIMNLKQWSSLTERIV